MESSAARTRRPEDCHRTRADLKRDLEVATRIEGFRWVEWNHRALSHTPVDTAGRFLGHPGDLLAHLYVDPAPGAPLSPDAFARLPHYSSDPALALRAAERAGVFRDAGARLRSTPGGRWTLEPGPAGSRMEDDSLPRLLVRAALRCAAPGATREAR